MDDASLLRRACKGDEVAFAELFSRYQRRVYRFASRMCGHSAGDDVVQDTFLAVLKGGFDPSKGSVAGYLFGIARHHVIRRLEQRGATMTVLDPDSPLPAAADDPPIDRIAREELIQTLREAVDRLPPLYREVVVLCDLEEMKYSTAAEAIGCPIGTVRSRLHRARSLLLSDLTTRAGHTERKLKHG